MHSITMCSRNLDSLNTSFKVNSKCLREIVYLLVDLTLGVVVVGHNTLGEPERDLLLRGLNGVGAVAHVATDVDAQVAADRAGQGVSGVRRAEQHASALHNAEALPHHADDRAGREVLAQAAEELLARQVAVVLLRLLNGGLQQLQANELVALVLEAADDLADEAALDAVGLHSNEGALGLGHS